MSFWQSQCGFMRSIHISGGDVAQFLKPSVMLTQGYKGSSISIASLQEVMSIHLLNPCSTQTNKGNHNCFFLLSFPLPSFKGLLPRRPTHFYVCFTAGSMELVSWRGFLFSPVLYNEAWVFVLGSSPLIMTRKKKNARLLFHSLFHLSILHW